MVENPVTRSEARRLAAPAPLLALLASTAGFVDAVGFLTLFQLFTAHMSGNSAALGAWLGQGRWTEGLHHLFPVPLFLVGIIAGSVWDETARRRGRCSRFAPILAVEAVLLAAFAVSVGTAPFYLAAALPVFAMGLQNSTLSRAAGTTVHTTYVTGVLNSFADSAVLFSFWLRDRVRGRRLSRVLAVGRRHPALIRCRVFGSVWLCYVTAAIAGSAALTAAGTLCLAAPVTALLLLALRDLRAPLD